MTHKLSLIRNKRFMLDDMFQQNAPGLCQNENEKKELHWFLYTRRMTNLGAFHWNI